MSGTGDVPARPATRPRALVTGATGYIGGRLIPELLTAGYAVRALARTPEKLRDHPWAERTEVLRGDVTDAESVATAMDGVDIAYYLVHALGSGRRFEDTDRRAAQIFARQARAAHVRRIVYLGGLTPEDVPEQQLSPHLRSRAEVADILLASGVPTAVLRAAVIIGSGSASFEMLRYLTERLPVMVTPSWVRTRIQPVAVRDVLRYLVGCARLPDDVSRAFDIGGPDVLSYRDMMQRYARVAELPERLILPVPMLTPRLSSLWIGLVTPVPPGLARPLAESLRYEVVCREHDIARYVPDPDPPGHPIAFDEALHLALRRVRDAEVATRWSNAAVPGAPSDPLPTDPDWAGGSLYTDRRERTVDAPPTPCGGWSRASVATTAGTPSRSPGRCAAGWTGWSAEWGCAAAGGTPAGCGSVTRSTSGASRRSPRAAAATARRDAAPRPGLAGTDGRPRRPGPDTLRPAGPVPPARTDRPCVLVVRLALPRRGVRRHGPQHRRRRGSRTPLPRGVNRPRGAACFVRHVRTHPGRRAGAARAVPGTSPRTPRGAAG